MLFPPEFYALPLNFDKFYQFPAISADMDSLLVTNTGQRFVQVLFYGTKLLCDIVQGERNCYVT